MFGRFLTSVQWGMAADKYGRVPVMMIGVISVFVFPLSVVFTFSLIACNLFENLYPFSGTLRVLLFYTKVEFRAP